MKEVSVEKFVDAVKQQTGMKMMYNSGVVREAGQVSVQVKDKELSEVLDMVLKKVNLEYELYNDIILIRAKGEVPAGPKVLKGVVKDKSGAVLPGVTVVIKGTTLGVSTECDIDRGSGGNGRGGGQWLLYPEEGELYRCIQDLLRR